MKGGKGFMPRGWSMPQSTGRAAYHYLVWRFLYCYSYLMTIQQTMEIPADRKIQMTLPEDIPAGATKLTVTVTVKPHSGEGLYIPVVSWFQKRREERFRRAVTRVAGKFAHVFVEDGVVLQRTWRDEWDNG
jgi:hypothetical protein